MITGYSDPINHALAFAAKLHDQHVRKGVRLPYLTNSANIALILTRYGQDEVTVLAGILHDALEDCVRDGYMGEMVKERVSEKFGAAVLSTVLAAIERRYLGDGIELSIEERKDDLLERLASADTRARWVVAADLLHSAGTLLADLRRTEFPETVWGRFAAGKEGTINRFRRVYDRLAEVGFDAPIMGELGELVAAMEGRRTEKLGRG